MEKEKLTKSEAMNMLLDCDYKKLHYWIAGARLGRLLDRSEVTASELRKVADAIVENDIHDKLQNIEVGLVRKDDSIDIMFNNRAITLHWKDIQWAMFSKSARDYADYFNAYKATKDYDFISIEKRSNRLAEAASNLKYMIGKIAKEKISKILVNDELIIIRFVGGREIKIDR